MRDPFVHLADPQAVQATPKVAPVAPTPAGPPTVRSSAYVDWAYSSSDYSSGYPPLKVPAVRAGDFMIAALTQWQGAYMDFAPSGWALVTDTTVSNFTGAGDELSLSIYSRTALSSSESFQDLPGNFNNAWQSLYYAGGIVAFRNVSGVVDSAVTAGYSNISLPLVSGEETDDIILNIVGIVNGGSYTPAAPNPNANAFISIPPGFDATYPPSGQPNSYAPYYADEGQYNEGPDQSPIFANIYKAMGTGAAPSPEFAGPQVPPSYVNNRCLFMGPSVFPGSLGTMELVGCEGPYAFCSAELLLR